MEGRNAPVCSEGRRHRQGRMDQKKHLSVRHRLSRIVTRATNGIGTKKGLKGKIVGCLYQNREWAYNGKTGWSAQPHSFIDVAKVRSGEFKLPADKPLDASQKPVSVDIAADTDEEDLPF